VAEHETTTRATTAKTIQIDFIQREFEVRGIAQKHTAIRGVNVTRWWHDRTEAIGIPFQSLVYEKYHRRNVDQQQSPKGKQSRGRRREVEVKVQECSLSLRSSCHRFSAHVAVSISSIVIPMEKVELLADLLGKHP